MTIMKHLCRNFNFFASNKSIAFNLIFYTLFEMFSLFLFFSTRYLFEKQSDKDRKKHFPSMCSFPQNDCNSRGWVRLKPGAWNPIWNSHLDSRDPSPGVTLHCLPIGTLTRNLTEQSGFERMLQDGMPLSQVAAQPAVLQQCLALCYFHK